MGRDGGAQLSYLSNCSLNHARPIMKFPSQFFVLRDVATREEPPPPQKKKKKTKKKNSQSEKKRCRWLHNRRRWRRTLWLPVFFSENSISYICISNIRMKFRCVFPYRDWIRKSLVTKRRYWQAVNRVIGVTARTVYWTDSEIYPTVIFRLRRSPFNILFAIAMYVQFHRSAWCISPTAYIYRWLSARLQ